MPRAPIDTGFKCCQVCGESFYRKKYSSGRYEAVDDFNDRGACRKPECVEEYKSRMQKESWDRRKGIDSKAELVRSPVDVWLSAGWSKINSVRHK